MTPRLRFMVGTAGVLLLILGAMLWFTGKDRPTPRRMAPTYAYDLATDRIFTVPGNTQWPCQAPSGAGNGVEVVVAQAPDKRLVPVLLSMLKSEQKPVRMVEGVNLQNMPPVRMIREPATAAWIAEDSREAAAIYARIQALTAKGYVLDVRPPAP